MRVRNCAVTVIMFAILAGCSGGGTSSSVQLTGARQEPLVTPGINSGELPGNIPPVVNVEVADELAADGHPGLPAFPAGDSDVFSPVHMVSATGRQTEGTGYVASFGANNRDGATAGEYVLIPEEGEIAWAMFSIADLTGDKPVSVELAVTPAALLPGGDDDLPLSYWIGVADFTKYHWSWHGPFADPQTVSINSEELRDRYVSKSGVLHWVAVVYGDDEVGLPGVTLQSGTVVIDSNYFANAPHYSPVETIEVGSGSGAGGGKATSDLDPSQYILVDWSHVQAFNIDDMQNQAIQYLVYRRGPEDLFPQNVSTRFPTETNYTDPTNTGDDYGPPTPGATYRYYIQAVNLNGFTPLSVPRTATVPFFAPTDLLATDGTYSNMVTLTWHAAEGAASYEVYRDTQDTPIATVSDDTANTHNPGDLDERSWDDEGVADYAIHTYWLKAVNQYATSDFSLPDAGNTAAGPVADLAILPGQESGMAPHLVNFDASASYDPDGGDIVTYDWDWDGVDPFDEPDGEATNSHTFATGGLYNPRVKVTDDEGVSAVAGVEVAVNEFPVADLQASPTSGNQPLTVDFDASGSTDNGTITDYEWDFDGDGVFNETDNGEDVARGNDTAQHEYDDGTFTAKVRVTDDAGAQDEASVEITSNNLLPTADLQADPTEGGVPLTVNFDASGSTDSDGTIVQYEWDWESDGTYDHDTGSEPTTTYEYTDAGNYTATVRITDNDGGTGTANVVIVVGGRGDWWMYGRNAKHASLSQYIGPATNSLDWSYTMGGVDPDVESSPAISSDGTIYVGSDNHKFYAFNPDGSIKWSFTTGGRVRSSPAIGENGIVYVGSGDTKLYAVYPDGTEFWSYVTGESIHSSPAIGADGTVYVGSYDDNLHAINPDGSEKWSYTTGGSIVNSNPAIGTDGTVFIGSADWKLHAVNPDGTQKWTYTLDGDMSRRTPAIATDGTVYMCSASLLYAINPDGSFKWSYTADSTLFDSAIGADGTVYVGSWSDGLYAINSDGTLKWTFPTGEIMEPSPAIGADGTIYVGARSKFYAINQDGTLMWSYPMGPVISSPAIGADGTVYVGNNDNNFYAIGPGNGPAAVLTADPVDGNFPLTVNFDASESFDVDGTIDDYEWDFDGNGVFNEAANGEDAAQGNSTPSPTYSTWGVYRAVVRVTDNDAKQDTAYIDINSNFTWHTHIVESPGEAGYFGISIADLNGKPAIAYREHTMADLSFARAITDEPSSSNDWVKNLAVDSPSSYGQFCSLAVLGTKPVVSYYNDVLGDLKYARATSATPTGVSDWQDHVIDNADDTGLYTSLAILDGKPMICYYDLTNRDLKFARASVTEPSNSGDWVVHTVVSTNDVGSRCSLAIIDGKPAISYYDNTNGDLEFARATTATPSTSGDWVIHTIDATGDVGMYTSIVDLNGKPAISYCRDDTDDLKFARATTATPSDSGDWVIHTVESSGDLGHWTSLDVINNMPVISYQEFTGAYSLRVALAVSPIPDKESDWLIYTVDTGGVGEYTSLAIINNQPYISYYDNTNGDLKFARPE